METQAAATDEGTRLFPTPGLQQLLDRFTQEYCLRFEEPVSNLFEFLTSNSIRSSDEDFLGEEDLTAFIAEAFELPFLTNSHVGAVPALFSRCQAMGFQRVSGGHVPVLTQGPGLLLAHYDPYVPLPACLYKENTQVVLCTWSTFQKLAEVWEQRYPGPSADACVANGKPPPATPREWAEWQLAYNPLTEEERMVLERIKKSNGFSGIPQEWEYWFSRKTKGQACISLDIVDVPQESKRVSSGALKAAEAVILFENQRLMQLGYVLNWDNFNSVETVAEQVRRQGLAVQLFPILQRDFNRFLEDQVNKTIQLSKYIKREDELPDSAVDTIDPAQFTDEDLDPQTVKIKTIAEAALFAAYKRGASDILIEPQTSDYRIRFTIDGINTTFFEGMPKQYGSNIVLHLKVRAGMNITEKRLPQDGKITLNIRGTPLEIRAATMPVLDSQEEKITLRLLSSTIRFPNLDKLGMRHGHLQLVRRALGMANGIVIVTGPTGSGKTTTLYSAVQEMDRERLSIVSLEDPIEIFVPGISQTQVNDAIGLTFARGLRALLRQAPQVILLGEIRDREVANIAVQAANTGHLVLTTLHTNSAIGTFDRLQALGAEAHQIADAVRLILAQRLIPRLCPVCRKSRKPAELEISRIRKQSSVQLNAAIYHANTLGCRNCHKGYTGRRIITEVIPVDAGMRELLLKGQTHSEIARHAQKAFGFRPILSQSMELVNEGQVDLKDAQKLFLDFEQDDHQ
ncbi:MAG TPA: GspE/PulE family protein [Verrucomicrobiota bacterium]|jgi:type II secretory ATPase GspE/PulE/Tfp pilus assembly ATPase PilB-like protein|nr:GspE/PulE family protein [Verrucomicrobiota bacterium]